MKIQVLGIEFACILGTINFNHSTKNHLLASSATQHKIRSIFSSKLCRRLELDGRTAATRRERRSFFHLNCNFFPLIFCVFQPQQDRTEQNGAQLSKSSSCVKYLVLLRVLQRQGFESSSRKTNQKERQANKLAQLYSVLIQQKNVSNSNFII